ncbi:MAG TPA: hypothetical protein VF756_22675 [Thermoanaerobaculia bacterium]
MKSLALVAALLLLAVASPAAAAPTGFDLPPLLHIEFDTVTIAAEFIHTSLTIHAGGATEIVETRENQPARITRGEARPQDIAELHRALQEGQVATQRGGCGDPAPDGPVEYEITWYGKGARHNTFRVGGNPTRDCPASTQRIVFAIDELVIHLYQGSDTQTFPGLRVR